MLVDEISIWFELVHSAESLPQCGWASSNLLRAKHKAQEREICPFDSCLTAGVKHLISSSLTLGLAFTSLAPFVLRLWDLDWITPLAFLGLQIINGSSWDFTVSIITWANSSFHIYVYAYKHTQTYTRPTGSVYLENPNTVNSHTYKHKDIHAREESIKKII